MAGRRLEQTRPTGHRRARGLVSDVQSGRRIEARRFAPHAELEELVEAYWAGWWDLPPSSPHDSRLIADPSVHLVFEHGTGAQLGARAVGVWTRLWRRTLEGRGRVLGVKLRPGAVQGLVDRPAHTLTNQILPLEALLSGTRDLHEALGPLEELDEAFERIRDWLVARRRDAPGAAQAIRLAARIRTDPELTSVEALARATGQTVRQLQRVFRLHVGATPKWVIRQHRLQEVALRLEQGHTHSLADLAATLGYSDQAHLARDFKAVVGKSPSQFLAELPGRSAARLDPGAIPPARG